MWHLQSSIFLQSRNPKAHQHEAYNVCQRIHCQSRKSYDQDRSSPLLDLQAQAFARSFNPGITCPEQSQNLLRRIFRQTYRGRQLYSASICSPKESQQKLSKNAQFQHLSVSLSRQQWRTF